MAEAKKTFGIILELTRAEAELLREVLLGADGDIAGAIWVALDDVFEE